MKRLGFLLFFSLAFQFGFAQNLPIQLNQNQSSQFYNSLEINSLSSEELEKLQALNLNKEEWQKLFSVFTEPYRVDKQAIIGKYLIDNQILIFIPRFAFVDDLTYLARFDLNYFYEKIGKKNPQPKNEITFQFSIAKIYTTHLTEVLAIYPSINEIPENQLKLYLQFSAPMSKGKIYQHIHFLNQKGDDIKPFLLIPNELWSEDGTRLTLFFDPGRIKRGLQPHKEMGVPLKNGEIYTLKIDSEWTDNQGVKLKDEFKKTFKVIASDRTQPQLDKWQIQTPKTQSLDNLKVTFNESLDFGLLQRFIKVFDAQGNVLEGKIEINQQETQWSFSPQKPWQVGEYTIRVHTRLEDLAGNSLRRLFDLADRQNDENQLNTEFKELKFTLGKL